MNLPYSPVTTTSLRRTMRSNAHEEPRWWGAMPLPHSTCGSLPVPRSPPHPVSSASLQRDNPQPHPWNSSTSAVLAAVCYPHLIRLKNIYTMKKQCLRRFCVWNSFDFETCQRNEHGSERSSEKIAITTRSKPRMFWSLLETQNNSTTTISSVSTLGRSVTPTTARATGKHSDSCQTAFGAIATQRGIRCTAFRSTPPKRRPKLYASDFKKKLIISLP